jgi:hypothetical protein
VADLSITETALGGGKIRYTLGRPNWEDRRIPDIRRSGATVQIEERRLIDIVILGDGFTSASDFRDALEDWLADFYTIRVYDTFAGCFRIRALYTPSGAPASASRTSYYGCLMSEDGRSIEGGDWWKASDADGTAFREAFWQSVDTFLDLNPRRYPLDLDVGSTNQAITNDRLRDLYRNLVVSLLVRSAATEHPSGFASDVTRPVPDQGRHVRVAFGAHEIHELGHAFGLLSDEYINGRNTPQTLTRVDPTASSVFSLSNLRYSDQVDDVPWVHLSPGGWEERTASGEEPSPLVGWLWVGGSVHLGVWHPEYRCLMNGSHDNFQFTQVAADDPTANPDGSYTDENGAGLRDTDRFCLWCQEVVTLRILEKTDQLLEVGDPSDVTSQGLVWYSRWVDELRPTYYLLFDVATQIADAEARYASLTPGRNGEPLWRSDLYSVPNASPVNPGPPVAPASDDEVFLLTGFAAIP